MTIPHNVELGAIDGELRSEVHPAQQPEHDREEPVHLGRMPELVSDEIATEHLQRLPPQSGRHGAGQEWSGRDRLGGQDSERHDEEDDVDDGRQQDRQSANTRVVRSHLPKSRQHACREHPEAECSEKQQPTRHPWEEPGSDYPGDIPHLVHGVLRRLCHPEAAPYQSERADEQRQAVGSQRVNVCLDLVTDDGELGECGMQHGRLEPGRVAQHVAEAGDDKEQQREHRQHAVVSHERGEAAAAIVAELLDDPERQAKEAVRLLKAVDPAQERFRVHSNGANAPRPRPRCDLPNATTGQRGR